MQYAVFVYVSSAKAVIQDLFLFLFKTKNRERSEHKQAARETSTLLRGKEKSKRIEKLRKYMQKLIFHIFLQKICLCQKKAVSLHPKSVYHFPLWVNNQKTLYYVSTIQV